MTKHSLFATILLCITGLAASAQNIVVEDIDGLSDMCQFDLHDLMYADNPSASPSKARQYANPGEAVVNYKDRIANMPQYLHDFIDQYVEAGHIVLDGGNTWLSDPTKGKSNTNGYYYLLKEVTGNADFTFAPGASTNVITQAATTVFRDTLEAEYDVLKSFLPYACLSLNLDHPEIFWIGSAFRYGYGSASSRISSYNSSTGKGTVNFTFSLMFYLYTTNGFDIRSTGISAYNFRNKTNIANGVQLFKSSKETILAQCPEGSRYDKLLTAHDWLTQHNCYNRYYPTNPRSAIGDTPWCALSALEGNNELQAPVCEGYARAFKVLCDAMDIPCILMAGNACNTPGGSSGGHMWNYVQMENRKWYAIDVTWDDPSVYGKTDFVSGFESHDWFLLGSTTDVGNFSGFSNFSFIESHPEQWFGGYSSGGSYSWDLLPGPELASIDWASEGANDAEIIFDTAGGSPIESIFQEVGSPITPPDDPTKEGYTFLGWEPAIPETMPEGGLTVVAQWQIKLATEIVLDQDTLIFNTTDTRTLSVTLAPADLIDKSVIWSSTNPDVAMVDENGVVTPVGNGMAYIIAGTTDGTELQDSCIVTVDFKAATLSIGERAVTITMLSSLKLNATVTPDKASQEVTWSSSDTTVVAIDEMGTITPRRNGEAAIFATTTDGTALEDTCMVTVDIPSLFEVTVTQTTLAVTCKDEVGEAQNIKLTIDGNEYNFGEEEAKITSLVPNSTYHVKANANINEYDWTEEFDVTTADIAVSFECKATPTTLEISASFDAGDATVTGAGFNNEEDVDTLRLFGLEPEQTYEYIYYITTQEGGTVAYKAQFATEALRLETLQTKVVQVGNVVVVASVNIVEEDTVSVGLEWRRYDWPDEIASKSCEAYFYEGAIEGSIKNLNAEKFWKIRPFFLSRAGNRHCGEWVTIDPSDASFFEPSVHTFSTTNIEYTTVELTGFVMEGTDDVESRGFKYWTASPQSSPKAKKKQEAPAIPADAKTVEATGNMMVASLDDLEPETEYCYVAFVKTTGNGIFYGEEQTFRTGPLDPDGIESLTPALSKREGEWYDLSGRQIANGKLPSGINIIRMSDGTTKKVLIK